MLDEIKFLTWNINGAENRVRTKTCVVEYVNSLIHTVQYSKKLLHTLDDVIKTNHAFKYMHEKKNFESRFAHFLYLKYIYIEVE